MGMRPAWPLNSHRRPVLVHLTGRPAERRLGTGPRAPRRPRAGLRVVTPPQKPSLLSGRR